MPFDERIRPDVASVLEAAALLDITEFDLFRLAWTRWHGAAPSDAELEPFFIDYMFRQVVPAWVRHFARSVERLDSDGGLDREAFGVSELPASRAMVRRGVRYAVLAGCVIVALVVCAEFAAEVLELGGRCMFPPCY